MKKMHRNTLLSLCLMIVMGCGVALAQDNITDKLKNRSNSGANKTEQKSDAGGGAAATSESPAASEAKKGNGGGSNKGAASGQKGQKQDKWSNRPGNAGATASRGEDGRYGVSGQTVSKSCDGYRVQVLFSSKKTGRVDAQKRAKEVMLKCPQYRAYISYVAPQWRLRIGDFKTYKDAVAAANIMKKSFTTFKGEIVVVPDHVNVWH